MGGQQDPDNASLNHLEQRVRNGEHPAAAVPLGQGNRMIMPLQSVADRV